MVADHISHDWRERSVQEWLLLLLRFAVTRAPSDQSMVLNMADELDSLGLRWRPSAPTFFQKTSLSVCEAILRVGDAAHDAVLRHHMGRIDNLRLRRAFEAAVGLQETAQQRHKGKEQRRRSPPDLWRGLPDE
jgi:hypothetical protein